MGMNLNDMDADHLGMDLKEVDADHSDMGLNDVLSISFVAASKSTGLL